MPFFVSSLAERKVAGQSVGVKPLSFVLFNQPSSLFD